MGGKKATLALLDITYAAPSMQQHFCIFRIHFIFSHLSIKGNVTVPQTEGCNIMCITELFIIISYIAHNIGLCITVKLKLSHASTVYCLAAYSLFLNNWSVKNNSLFHMYFFVISDKELMRNYFQWKYEWNYLD